MATILRARFVKTLGLHCAGETYLIEEPELREALAVEVLDRASIQIEETQAPPSAAKRAELEALIAPAPEELPEIPAVEDAPPGGEA